ncbi:hypothetical protein BASA60_006474 [Batrachochytrium salamandrivorans]|nr:hypothetical protein BASA60_006474 [Batrachochytrium salamandrivorans]
MITDTPEILNLIGNVLSVVAVGDELLTVNGVPFDKWYDQNKFILGFGANDSGGQRGAFQYLAEISGDSNILPEYDSITFQLRRLAAQGYRLSLFDVRGNGGGLISAADGIIQLFKSDATASQFRYLKNGVTKSLFYNELNSKSPWSKAWGAPSDISRYSGFGSMEDSSTFNTFGQAYFNPVGVYTNGVCYSACETFASHIQDHGIGTIFGEDETTGGGGANVLSSDDAYFTDRPLEYIADPFKEKLTGKTSGQKFYTRVTVGARQLMRSGNYAGELVEDNGVKSDVIVRSTIADILPGDRGASNYDRIANYLGDVAKRQADSKIYFISEPYDRVTFEDSINILFVASGVDEIIAVYQGKKLGSWKRKLLTLSQTHVITVQTPTGLHDHLITFIGTKQEEQVFKTQRQITRIPTPNNRVSMNTAKSYTVLGPSSSTGVYSFGSMSEKDGWIFNDDKWVIGDGISDYSGRVESYKYLGVLIDSKLDHSAWLKQKRSALEHTISALHPVLANHQLTVNYRSRIFSAVVMGKAYYELELVGGNKSHLAPLKTTINKGIRCSLGPDSRLPLDPFWLKLGLNPFSLAHWYHGAVGKIPALVLVSSDQTAVQEQILADTTGQTKDSQATALVCIDGDSANMWRLCITPKQLLSTSIAHLVVECEQVTGHRIQSGLVPAIQKSRLRLLGRALDPGVENVYTWLRGGVLNGEADLDQRWLDGTVEHESMGTRHDNRDAG